MKDKDKFVVAMKDTSQRGLIRPGKTLSRFRKKEFALHALPGLIRSSGHKVYNIGIFHKGKLIY